ncbi:MAG: hypothetical protein RL322_2270 [Pseudomonadota bacterium]
MSGGRESRVTAVRTPSGRAAVHRRQPVLRGLFQRVRAVCASALVVAGTPPFLQAAPLDGFVEAVPHQYAPRTGYVEWALDHMNQRLDVFNLRPAEISDDSVGNLKGLHLRAGYGFSERTWMDAGLFRRNIRYGELEPALNTWQLGVQHSLLASGLASRGPDLAIRASVWGNLGPSIAATPAQLKARPVFSLLDGLSVDRPSDRQAQLDLISSWWLGSSALTAFAGMGRGTVSVDSVTARLGALTRRWIDGQFYDENGQVDTIIAPIVQQLGLADELNAINYSTRFAHAGLGIRVPIGERWGLRAAYQYFHISRSSDDLIAARSIGQVNYASNHTLLGEISYRFTGQARLFLRGQAMSNQFLGEMPLLYNSLTAHRFDEKYGIVSLGVIVGF